GQPGVTGPLRADVGVAARAEPRRLGRRVLVGQLRLVLAVAGLAAARVELGDDGVLARVEELARRGRVVDVIELGLVTADARVLAQPRRGRVAQIALVLDLVVRARGVAGQKEAPAVAAQRAGQNRTERARDA